jgi:hypothetical protein
MTSQPNPSVRAPWHTTGSQLGRHVCSSASTLNMIKGTKIGRNACRRVKGAHGQQQVRGGDRQEHDEVMAGTSRPGTMPMVAVPPCLHSCAVASSSAPPVVRCDGRRWKPPSRHDRTRSPPTRVEVSPALGSQDPDLCRPQARSRGEAGPLAPPLMWGAPGRRRAGALCRSGGRWRWRRSTLAHWWSADGTRDTPEVGDTRQCPSTCIQDIIHTGLNRRRAGPARGSRTTQLIFSKRISSVGGLGRNWNWTIHWVNTHQGEE